MNSDDKAVVTRTTTTNFRAGLWVVRIPPESSRVDLFYDQRQVASEIDEEELVELIAVAQAAREAVR